MTDLSMQGATLTITGGGGVGSVTFKDLSDDGTPLGHGGINPINTSRTLNGRLLAWHNAKVLPEFTLGVIPNSDSDKALRSLLLSCLVSPQGNVKELSDVMLEKAVLKIPGHKNSDGSTSSSRTFTYTKGFLVGGSSAIGTTGEGRMTNGPYRFQWEEMTGPE